jgi:hypothetical protein
MGIVKAVLIDPFACSVHEVDLDADDYTSVHRLLCHSTHRVDYFTAAYPDTPYAQSDSIFVDEEGALKPITRFFKVYGYQTVLAGKGLVVGSDATGEPHSYTTNLEMIRRTTFYYERVEGMGLIRTFAPWAPRHEPAIAPS